MEVPDTKTVDCLEFTADIVSAYVSNNPVPVDQIPSLIASVNKTLKSLGQSDVEADPAQVPSINPKRSVQQNFIICLEDGLKFKSLKRHLMTHYGMTPEEYREKWKLPRDYPMVAPSYSAERSALAKQMGLGRKPATFPVKRGRKPNDVPPTLRTRV